MKNPHLKHFIYNTIKYKVSLTKEEHLQLKGIIDKGIHSSQQYRTAYILFNSDEGEYGDKLKGKEISRAFKVSMRMIDRVKQRFVQEGFEACLSRKPLMKVKDKKVNGELEARLIAISCSKAPNGFSRWSLRMFADKMIELEYVESISYETIRKVLKKTN